jgi:CHAT domain-containing protein
MVRALRAGRVRVDTPAGSIRLPEHPVLWAGFVLVGEP